MNYVLAEYKRNQWAIFCCATKCWVLFGPKQKLKKRIVELSRAAEAGT